MSTTDDIVRIVLSLCGSSPWSKHSIATTLAVSLKRDPKTVSTHKHYVSNRNSWIEKATFLHPTYGAVGNMHVRIAVDWHTHVLQDQLKTLIPERPVVKFNPLPTPGGGGPARFSFSVHAQCGDCSASFSFERRDGSPPYLYAIHLERRSPPHTGSESASSHFRSYALVDERPSYVVERIPEHSEAIEVKALTIEDRTLSLSFRVLEDWLSEAQAQSVIRDVLLFGLLESELTAKIDTIVFESLDLNSTKTQVAIPKAPQ
jgi:hypothetical protein